MLTIIETLKKEGLLKNDDFLNPRVIKKPEEGITFPRGSLLVTDRIVETPLKLFIYLDTNAPETTCTTTRLRTNRLVLINQRKGTDKTSVFVNKRDQINTSSSMQLAVHDLSSINSVVTYKGMTAEHCRLGAAFKAKVRALEGDNTKHLIVSLPAPSKVPTYQEMIKMFNFKGKKLTNRIDPDFFPWFEIIKFLLDKPSIFKMTFEQAMMTTILVESEKHYVYFKFDALFNLFGKTPDEYKTKIDKRTPKLAVTMLLNIITTIKHADIETEDAKVDTVDKEVLDNVVNPMVNTTVKDETKLAIELEEINEQKQDQIRSMTPIAQIDSTFIMPPKDIVEHKSTINAAEEALRLKVIEGVITERKAKTMLDIIKDNEKDIPKLTPKDLEFTNIKIPDLSSVVDKSQLENSIDAFDTKGLEVYDDQTKQIIHHIERAGYAVKKHKVISKEDFSNHTKQHIITIIAPDGKQFTIKPIVPVIAPDGNVKFNGKNYVLQKQKIDAPIKKIDEFNVLLTSYVSKYFISKANSNRNDIGMILKKQMDKNPSIKTVIEGKNTYGEIKLPIMYKILARHINTITVNSVKGQYDELKLQFLYHDREKLLEDGASLKTIEKNGVLVGVEKSRGKVLNYITMTDADYFYDATFHIGKTKHNLQELLGTTSTEYVTVKLAGKNFPIGLPMLVWFGFDKLLANIDAKFKTHRPENKYVLDDKEYVIKFLDRHFVFPKDDVKNTFILSGLNQYAKVLKDISSTTLNDTSGVLDFFLQIGLTDSVMRELTLAEKIWVDPLTKIDLLGMNEPTELPALFIRACEMLVIDEYVNQNHIVLNRIKGVERMNAFLLTSITQSLRGYNNKMGKVRAILAMSPYEISNLLAAESTFRLVEDLSPVSERAIRHTFTLTGTYGRNSDAVTTMHRTYHESEVGFVSENTKNTADVGIVGQLSATPKMTNANGLNKDVESSELTTSNYLSEAGQLQAESLKQDTKRLLFQSIQSPAVVPTYGDHANQIRTGFEAVYAYRVGDKYAGHATVKGKVTKVTPKLVIIDYGKETKKYPLRTWFSRDEGGVTYKHYHKTLLTEGQVVKVGDNIYYDATVLSPNILEKNRVVYNNGQSTLIALNNGSNTFEDSCVISKGMAAKLTTPLTYVIDKVVNLKETLLDRTKIGDHVAVEDSLFTNIPKEALTGVTDKKVVELLKELASNSLRAGHNGTVKAIEIIYRSELTGVDKGMVEFIKETNVYMKEIYGTFGKVDHTYSTKGRGLEEDEAHVKYFVEHDIPMGLGDKGMFANQLKWTVGEVTNKITAVYKDTEYDINGLFNDASVSARIVVSPITIGRANMILQEVSKQVINAYRGN